MMPQCGGTSATDADAFAVAAPASTPPLVAGGGGGNAAVAAPDPQSGLVTTSALATARWHPEDSRASRLDPAGAIETKYHQK